MPYGCHCQLGFIGGGCLSDLGLDCSLPGCSPDGHAARVVFDVTGKTIDGSEITPNWNGEIEGITYNRLWVWADKLFGTAASDFLTNSSLHHRLSETTIMDPASGLVETKTFLSINMVFASSSRASLAADVFNNRKGKFSTLIQQQAAHACVRPRLS
eukprot:2021425-Rhodomonas_salina.1